MVPRRSAWGASAAQLLESLFQTVEIAAGRVVAAHPVRLGGDRCAAGADRVAQRFSEGVAVRFFGGGCTTQSIVMRSKSGTVRMIDAYHRLSKLNEYSAVDFTGDSSAAYPLP